MGILSSALCYLPRIWRYVLNIYKLYPITVYVISYSLMVFSSGFRHVRYPALKSDLGEVRGTKFSNPFRIDSQS